MANNIIIYKNTAKECQKCFSCCPSDCLPNGEFPALLAKCHALCISRFLSTKASNLVYNAAVTENPKEEKRKIHEYI